MTDELLPRVWVGCLGCYNAGHLIGEWFDATDAPDDVEDFNERLGIAETGPMVTKLFGVEITPSPSIVAVENTAHRDHLREGHEELWVMDHEGFDGVLAGECSPSEAREVAEALANVYDHDALQAFSIVHSPREYDTAKEFVTAFEDACYAVGDSAKDAAWEFLEDTGYFLELPEHMESHKGAIAEDWYWDNRNGGTIAEVHYSGNTYLFID